MIMSLIRMVFWVAVIVIIYAIRKARKGGSRDQTHNSTNGTIDDSPSARIDTYCMKWSHPNEVIGAIDKSAEFIGFAKDHVLNKRIATDAIHPGSAFLYAICDLRKRKMQAGFSYNTDDWMFREEIKHCVGTKMLEGYSLDEGFWFNEDSGMISYSWETELSETALEYISGKPKAEIEEHMRRIVVNNRAAGDAYCKINYVPQEKFDLQIGFD